MKNVMCGLVSNELEILDKEGIKYTVLDVTQVDYFDVYTVRIDGDFETAQDILYNAIR